MWFFFLPNYFTSFWSRTREFYSPSSRTFFFKIIFLIFVIFSTYKQFGHLNWIKFSCKKYHQLLNVITQCFWTRRLYAVLFEDGNYKKHVRTGIDKRVFFISQLNRRKSSVPSSVTFPMNHTGENSMCLQSRARSTIGNFWWHLSPIRFYWTCLKYTSLYQQLLALKEMHDNTVRKQRTTHCFQHALFSSTVHCLKFSMILYHKFITNTVYYTTCIHFDV